MEPPVNGDPPPPQEQPPVPPVYKRGSLRPLYQLTPEQQLPRFNEQGLTFVDADFTVNVAAGFTSASAKMDEVARQLGAEKGTVEPEIVGAADRPRADKIPFRGNPTDVKLLSVNGRREAWVPLGGDLMTPGNEIVAMDITNAAAPTRTQIIKVGVRPQRIAIHPAQPTQLAFVCNMFSNYISVIDVQTHKALVGDDGQPVEVPTEFYCTDLVFAPRNANNQDKDNQDLYVANSYRRSVMKYGINLVRNGVGNRITGITVDPVVEITGAGPNPTRLTVAQDLRTLFVANSRGGVLARVDLATGGARTITFNGPSIDVVQSNEVLIVPTTTIDRGLPDSRDQMPTPVFSPEIRLPGLDGQQHVVHPGSLQDNTKAYNFEDLRNGFLSVDAQLNNNIPTVYYTDDVSPEANFVQAQKIVQGSIPAAVVIDQATHTRVFAALSGSDAVQEFRVQGGAFRLADGPSPLMQTGKRPMALALDEQANQVVVVTWGGESIEIFNAANGQRLSVTDLGYGGNGNAALAYPATNMERGEYLFYNTAWSNNGRKSCGQCHLDELLIDGIPYANGATAASAYHKVPANFNLMETDNYFWNGSFSSGTYASLASDAQSRSNCELILFGQIEGISSDPNTRVGDANNIGSLGAAMDQLCRPDLRSLVSGVLPANFDATIAGLIAQSKIQRDANIKVITQAQGLGANIGFKEVSRFVDWYDVSELRLPPNPLAYQLENNQLDATTTARVAKGQTLFTDSGCGNCHQPGNNFTDNRNHGSGATWANDFIRKYAADPRLTRFLPAGIPSQMLQAAARNPVGTNDKEINVHANVDAFIPFCFDGQKCLQFDDPLASAPGSQAETNRLEAIIKINLGNVERGFMPGNVPSKFAVNTPSLRGLFIQPNFLRHGLARTLNETILAPGHPALRTGEKGFAVDRTGTFNVHGNTQNLKPEEVDDLYLYLTSIK